MRNKTSNSSFPGKTYSWQKRSFKNLDTVSSTAWSTSHSTQRTVCKPHKSSIVQFETCGHATSETNTPWKAKKTTVETTLRVSKSKRTSFVHKTCKTNPNCLPPSLIFVYTFEAMKGSKNLSERFWVKAPLSELGKISWSHWVLLKRFGKKFRGQHLKTWLPETNFRQTISEIWSICSRPFFQKLPQNLFLWTV